MIYPLHIETFKNILDPDFFYMGLNRIRTLLIRIRIPQD